LNIYAFTEIALLQLHVIKFFFLQKVFDCFSSIKDIIITTVFLNLLFIKSKRAGNSTSSLYLLTH